MRTVQIKVHVYLKRHLRPSYELTFESETTCESFITSLNADVDYIRIADEVIERRTIRKVTIKYE